MATCFLQIVDGDFKQKTENKFAQYKFTLLIADTQ